MEDAILGLSLSKVNPCDEPLHISQGSYMGKINSTYRDYEAYPAQKVQLDEGRCISGVDVAMNSEYV